MTRSPKPLPYAGIEELAFWPVTRLARLIRTRKVSSVELTRMYLNRLRQSGPRLNCVMTLTRELAISQAEQADAELRKGKYGGPLYGILWGAEDLFAIKEFAPPGERNHLRSR